MWSLFDTREVEAFGTKLAQDLARRFPPASEARTDKAAQRQVKDILDDLATQAARYHRQHKLGVYKTAKLGNVFKWKLSELGYSAAFVENATGEIVRRLAAR
jgi:hypothetical protein